MSVPIRWSVLATLLAMLVLFEVPEAKAQPAVRPSTTVPDKNLFALRAVASVQRQLVFNLKGLPPAEAITDAKLQLAALAKLFAKEGVDDDIVQMLRDVQELTGDYAKYGLELDALDEAALEKLNERIGLGERFVVALGTAGAGALIEPLTGTAIGFLAGLFLSEGYEEISRRRKAGLVNDERWNKIQAAKNALESRMEADYLRHQKTVNALTARYGWKAGEGGLDAKEIEVAGFNKSLVSPGKGIDTTVLDERLKGLAAWTERRPRDPFTRLEYVVTAGQREALKKIDTPSELRASATRFADLALSCRVALDHIPAGDRYDPYRAEVFLVAGECASSAATLDVLASGKGAFGVRSGFARAAVKNWEECLLRSEALDPNGYIRMRLAFAFAHDGQIEKGMALADKVAKLRKTARCAQFATNYARLKALAGKHELAIEWLEFAAKDCGVNPSVFKDDPHLLVLKKSQAARFEALLTKRP